MAAGPDIAERALTQALSGSNAHVGTADVLAGLDWKLAGVRPDGAPHSVFEIANHAIYWLEWVVKWLDGRKPRPPKHAAGGWPGRAAPANRKQWDRCARRYCDALRALERRAQTSDLLSGRGKMTRLEMLQAVASHSSYHAGQVVLLRQMLGAWPPPSGGLTW